ncbi:zinc finger SWIM domain-containing protein 1-like [Rana temporaria]|uniref:zinc finger SWIM domain-containing protein 1-like n=1 Tax=Rana temporaria TaxID=8407 RepID=UPI001AAC63DD|nr:zinc finger SWIM domain-containing protein 1-like [Rana temporaria]XP_040186170.1 zinc finger SWIM domain-containing protein 1-like [Rana temporaria]XP_040186171.1 zinc finger SWIM domain-containing protein 1-like [Rana temporaria]XP_040186172.1 zinc finger SWIM domain-containing protein 1-like [Rana temporaria]
MASHYLDMFMATDPGSKVAFHFHKGSVLDFLNLQTSTMCKWFKRFPEVIFIIRSQDAQKKTLYTFLADGPYVPTTCQTERILHIAVPKNESHEGLTDMFRVLKDFNNNWQDIRIFLVDHQFKGADAIRKVFPSAEVVLSAYHICRHFQQSIYQSLSSQTEHLLIDALKNTMCSATKENLKNMHTMLNQFVKPSMLMQLKADWLLEDRIWALHRWKSSTQCFEYFQTIETLSHAFTEIFRNTRDTNAIPKLLVKYIQENAFHTDLVEKRTCTSQEIAIIDCKLEEPEEANRDLERTSLMVQALQDIRNPSALSLCQKELEVAQKSVKVIGTNEVTTNVQLLEHPSEVSYGTPATCSCSFNQVLKLPCRHILAVITASEKVVQSDMIQRPWQAQAGGSDSNLPVSSDILEVIKGGSTDVPEKELTVESLTNQLSELLSECSEDTFQQRYNTLRELADAWIGPYEQVKL